MSENKGLGIENLGSVDWLNDSSPAPEAAETQQEEVTEPVEAVTETAEEEVAEPTPEVPTEETIEETTVEAEMPAEETTVEEPQVAEAPEASMFATLGEKLGYQVEGDFAEDYDGLAAYTNAVGQQIANEQLEKMFAAMPDVKEYMEYRANNGDPIKYFEAQRAELDYNDITIDDNVAVQKRVVIDALRQQGIADENIAQLVDSYEDAGILKDNASIYLTQLQNNQANYKQQMLAQQQAEAEKQRAEAEAYWNGVQETINTGNLKGMSIPTRQRGKFYEWMTTPVNDQGYTQRDIDRQNIDQETALAVEYLLYQGFDLKKLAQNAASTQKVSSLKSKLTAAPSAGSRMKSRTKSGTTKANTIPSLKDLL